MKSPVSQPDFHHLHVSAAEHIHKSCEERAEESLKNKAFWVPSAQFNAALEELDWLANLPRGRRIENLSLVADPGSGKSTLLEVHQKKLGRIQPPDSAGSCFAHSIFDLTAIQEDEQLLRMIGRYIGCPLPRTFDVLDVLDRLSGFACRMKSRMWSFDEIQSILHLPPKISSRIIQAIKGIANRVDFPLVVAGSRDSASVFNDETHMRQRFRPWTIKSWRFESGNEQEEFHAWFYGFVSRLPLREPSEIFANPYLAEIVARSRGNTERIVIATRRSAGEALRRGKECIDPQRMLGLL